MGGQNYLLIVSSDPDLLQTLSFALAVEEFPVSTVTTWAQAMALCSSTPPAMIIHKVRGLDGRVRGELLGLRRIHPEVSVLLLPSLDSPELSEAEQAGLIAASFVKPPRLEAIEECLVQLGIRRQTRKHATLAA